MLVLDRRWERPAPTRDHLRRDAVIGLVAAVLSLISVEVWRSGHGSDLGWHGIEAYVLFGVAGLLLGLRCRFPLTTLLIQAVLFTVIGVRLGELGLIFTIQVVFFATLYSAWGWSRTPWRLYITSAVVLVAMFGWLIREIALAGPPDLPNVGLLDRYGALIVYALAVNVVYFLGAMTWGHSAWRSARQRAELAERVDAERQAQDRDRERAVQDERVRIARDLHDVVAHHVSGIGVQAAGAGRVLDARPDEARQALDVIERSSRQAVQQMHQLVGLLRAEDERHERSPQPGLGELSSLASLDARPAVSFRQVGESFEVPPTVAVSLFRIAQEAVANLRRHASAASGEVVLRFAEATDDSPATVEVEVIDDGSAVEVDTAHEGSGGFGLTGIRERAAMHGGACEIGPRPEGGFRVRVWIPVAI